VTVEGKSLDGHAPKLMLIEALQSILANAATVNALVGTTATRPDSTTGIFPVQAIDIPAMPYLVLSQVSGQPLQTSMQGTGALTTERWRISCHGTTFLRAKKLAKTVRQVLLSVNGAQAGSAFVMGAWCVLEADDAEALSKGTLYSTHLDFNFTYQDGDV
jgi:hypothetical protein